MNQAPFPVLVLEDDPELRQVLEDLLRDEGYAVSAAASGEEAIEMARRQRFDLIVADIRMPGMDGLEAVQHLRGHDPRMQSLVMTGYASEEDPIRALHIGVQAYLRKPFSLDDFLTRVRELLQKNVESRQQEAVLHRLSGSLQWSLRQTLTEGVKVGTRTMGDLLQLVEQLARGLGLRSRSGVPTWLECAALVGCLRRYGLGGAHIGREPDWPEPVEEILAALGEQWDGQGIPDGLQGEAIPVGSRLVALALRSWELGVQPGHSNAAQIVDQPPGRFDPKMLEWLSTSYTEMADSDDTLSSARLLSLASILLEKGAYRQLREIYGEVLACQCLLSQRLEALLGMTQVSLAEGLVSEAIMYGGRLVKASEGAGPITQANCLLRLGLSLAARGLEAGHDCLSQARIRYTALRHTSGVVEASLALAYFANQLLEIGPDQMTTFFRQQGMGPWLRSSAWAISCLLDRYPEEAAVRSIARQVQRAQPDLLKRLQESGRLSDIGKRRLESLLSEEAPVAEENTAEVSPLQIYSLASFEAFYLGLRLDERRWPTQKVKYLAARLLLDLGRGISEDSLIDEFWAGELEKGRRNLGWCLTQLRKILRENLGDLIKVARRGNTVALVSEKPIWHDVDQLTRLLEKAESAPLEAEGCAEILSLYRGPFLPEHYLDWAVSFRERLDSRVGGVLTRALVDAERLTPAVKAEVAYRLLDLDPCHQTAALELMVQASAQGRPEETVRIFKRLSARLHSDLGIEPDLRLVEVFCRADLGLPALQSGS